MASYCSLSQIMILYGGWNSVTTVLMLKTFNSVKRNYKKGKKACIFSKFFYICLWKYASFLVFLVISFHWIEGFKNQNSCYTVSASIENHNLGKGAITSHAECLIWRSSRIFKSWPYRVTITEHKDIYKAEYET